MKTAWKATSWILVLMLLMSCLMAPVAFADGEEEVEAPNRIAADGIIAGSYDEATGYVECFNETEGYIKGLESGSTVTYNDVVFEGATALYIESCSNMGRKLYVDVYLNDELVASAFGLDAEKVANGRRFWTLPFGKEVTGTYTLYITTPEEDSVPKNNEEMHKFYGTNVIPAELDGFAELTARDASFNEGDVLRVDAVTNKIEGFERGNKYFGFPYVNVDGAEYVIIKTTAGMDRNLTMNVFTDRISDDTLIGKAQAKVRYYDARLDETIEEGVDDNYAYYVIYFAEPLEGVHHMLFNTGDWEYAPGGDQQTNNEHILSIRFGNDAEADGVPADEPFEDWKDLFEEDEPDEPTDTTDVVLKGSDAEVTAPAEKGDFLTNFIDGSTATFSGVNFNNHVALKVESASNFEIDLDLEVRLDSADGTLIGKAEALAPDAMRDSRRFWTIPFDEAITGEHNLVLVATGSEASQEFDKFTLVDTLPEVKNGHEDILVDKADFLIHCGLAEANKLNKIYKIEGFENDYKGFGFNYVEMNNAEYIIVRTSKHMSDRPLNMNAYIDSVAPENLVGQSIGAQMFLTEECNFSTELYGFYPIKLTKKLSGVHHLILTTVDNSLIPAGKIKENQHIYGVRLASASELIRNGLETMSAGYADIYSGTTNNDGKLHDLNNENGVTYSFVDFGDNATSIDFEFERMIPARTVTMMIYTIDPFDGTKTRIGMVRGLSPREDDNGRDYLTVDFSRAVSGVKHLRIEATVNVSNPNIFTIKINGEVAPEKYVLSELASENGVYSIDVTKKAESATGVITLLVAKYDVDGRLVELVPDEADLDAMEVEGTDSLSVEMTAGEGETVRAFVWNGFENMMPLI